MKIRDSPPPQILLCRSSGIGVPSYNAVATNHRLCFLATSTNAPHSISNRVAGLIEQDKMSILNEH